MDRPVVASGTEAEFREALGLSQLPFVVTDNNEVIRLANRATAELLGMSATELIGRPGPEFLGPSDAVAAGRNALLSGAVSSMRSELHVHRPDGTTVPIWIWTRMVEIDGSRAAVSILVPRQEAASPATEAWRMTEELEIAVGIADTHWRVEMVSSDIQVLTGAEPGDVIGSSLRQLVHPDDSAAFDEDHVLATAGVEVRLRRPDDTWREATVYYGPGPDPADWAFAIIATQEVPSESSEGRIAELEFRLRRIGTEVRAARVVDRIPGLPDAGEFPQLSELSARQWEILSRLLDGERVPTIANELYLSQSTVRNHLAAIFKRFGVHSQTELLELLRPHR
jgi:PAS domain S-box-containing protein